MGRSIQNAAMLLLASFISPASVPRTYSKGKRPPFLHERAARKSAAINRWTGQPHEHRREKDRRARQLAKQEA